VHIAIDDCTRLAYAEVLPDQHRRTVIAFLRRAVAFYTRHGITVQRVLTDNGGAYRSTIHAAACRTLAIRHLRTRADRPQTNGKAERFIRTLLGGWAHGAIYRSSAERTAALDGWLWPYGCRSSGGSDLWVGSFRVVRVTDEAKRRHQGLVACRAAVPFEGLSNARPGVAPAPPFVAVQSVTSRR
jgi:Integrase core domain